MTTEKERKRVFDRTALMTWPDLTVEVHLFPWQWRLVPRGWYDYSPRHEAWTSEDGTVSDPGTAGWWGIDGEWLFLKVRFGFNLPPFESPWQAIPTEKGGE